MPRGFKSVSTLDPMQKAAWPQLFQMANLQQSPLFQQGSNYLQNLLSGSPEAFQSFEAPFMRQFQEQIIPQLAERFSGVGARNSSGFQQALGQAGAGLSENLASLRSGLQMQALPQSLNFAQAPFNNLRSLMDVQTQAFLPKQPSGWQRFLSGITPGLGSGLGMLGGMSFGRGFF